METHISDNIRKTPAIEEAEAILRSCVHCGFCTATCPTYQLLGNELDGPRGRIYLIKQMLETGQASNKTRTHLDRCLLCRACESTCPSGVRYARLLHTGKHLAYSLAPASLTQRGKRQLLKGLLPYPKRLSPLLSAANLFRPLLPNRLKSKIPAVDKQSLRTSSADTQSRHVILFQGCVQSIVAGSINTAAQNILQRLGIQSVNAQGEGCCGAVHHHLDDKEHAQAMARNNLDRWWTLLEQGAEAVLFTASACALEAREYPLLFSEDHEYRQKSEQILPFLLEIGEFICKQNTDALRLPENNTDISFHAPCTLQHGLNASAETETLLRRLGFKVREPEDAHLCCGSAGTYSILQPELSTQLRDNKLAQLNKAGGKVIASANIGCLMHLQAGTSVPVKHWIEWLDQYTRKNIRA